MRKDAPSLRAIADVAELLGELRQEVVFVGGATIPLLITDEAAPADRPTDDVDVVVEATSAVTYYQLAERLKARGFIEDRRDEPPVICRWMHGAYRVDAMPVEGSFMGFRGAWFRAVCDSSWSVEVGPGVTVRVARAPELLATKAEAFADRGRDDFVLSKDIQDFISLVDGRPELVDEVRDSPAEVRQYICEVVGKWLPDGAFMEALSGHLPGDDASQQRISLLIMRRRASASLTTP